MCNLKRKHFSHCPNLKRNETIDFGLRTPFLFSVILYHNVIIKCVQSSGEKKDFSFQHMKCVLKIIFVHSSQSHHYVTCIEFHNQNFFLYVRNQKILYSTLAWLLSNLLGDFSKQFSDCSYILPSFALIAQSYFNDTIR